jgi:hypothetical protein
LAVVAGKELLRLDRVRGLAPFGFALLHLLLKRRLLSKSTLGLHFFYCCSSPQEQRQTLSDIVVSAYCGDRCGARESVQLYDMSLPPSQNDPLCLDTPNRAARRGYFFVRVDSAGCLLFISNGISGESLVTIAVGFPFFFP